MCRCPTQRRRGLASVRSGWRGHLLEGFGRCRSPSRRRYGRDRVRPGGRLGQIPPTACPDPFRPGTSRCRPATKPAPTRLRSQHPQSPHRHGKKIGDGHATGPVWLTLALALTVGLGVALTQRWHGGVEGLGKAKSSDIARVHPPAPVLVDGEYVQSRVLPSGELLVQHGIRTLRTDGRGWRAADKVSAAQEASRRNRRPSTSPAPRRSTSPTPCRAQSCGAVRPWGPSPGSGDLAGPGAHPRRG